MSKRKFAVIMIAAMTGFTAWSENMFFNSSFELGTRGYAGARDIPYAPGNEIAYTGSGFEIDTSTAVHGDKSLKIRLFDTDSGNIWRFVSQEVELKSGQKYTFSFYAKSNADVNIQITFLSLMGAWKSAFDDVKSLPVGRVWKRHDCSFVFNPKLEPKQIYESKYFLRISFPKQNTTVWLDALQLEEGGLTLYAPSKPVEMAVYAPFVLNGNIPAKGTLQAISYDKPLKDYPLEMNLEDDFSKAMVEKKEINLNLPVGKSVEKEFAFDSKRLGSFRITTSLEDAAAAYCSAGYFVRVVSPVKSYGKGYQPGIGAGPLQSIMIPFGETAKAMIWYNTYGNPDEYPRLTRLSGATFTHSYNCGGLDLFDLSRLEPEKGKFDWRLLDKYVALAEQNNLAPLLVLPPQSLMAAWNGKTTGEKVAKWLRNLDRLGKPDGTRLGDWTNNQIVVPPPEVIGEFFDALSKRYGNKIKAYQLFAEANGYMPPVYMVEYMAAAYKAIKKNSPEAEFIGITPTEDQGSKTGGFFGECLKLGAAKYCDSYALHPYTASMDDSPVSAMDGIRNLRKVTKEYHAEKIFWDTEVYYLLPVRQSHYTLEDRFSADAVARRLIIDMGEGIMRSCPLPFEMYFHNPIVPNNPTRFIGDQRPSDRFAVFSAAARFITGAEPLKTLELSGNVLCYVFRNDDKLYSAIWSIRDKVAVKLNLPDNGVVVIYDLFGNQVKTATGKLELALDRCPIYLEWQGLDAATIARTFDLGQYKREMAISVTDPKLVKDSDGKNCIGIVLRNETTEKLSGMIRVTSKYLKNSDNGISYGEIPSNQSKKILIPVRLISTAPDSFELKINISAQSKLFNYSKMLKNIKQLEVKTENWTEDILFSSDKTISAQDFGATFALSYDSSNLLVKVKVTDDKRSPAHEANCPWTGDSVELFLDLNPLGGDLNFMDLYHDLCFQLVIPTDKAGNPTVVRAMKGKLANTTAPLTGIKAVVNDVPGGYEVNIRIPLENTIGRLQGRNIGFTLIVNDNDAGKNTYSLVWTGKKNYCDRSGFAMVHFQ
ncbi:MAG: sugar-binding protein [Victivallaceae bacterium]